MSKGLNVEDLWTNESVQAMMKNTRPEDLHEYQKITSTIMANASYTDPTKNIIDSACQIRIMLRDGLPAEMLTEEEKQVFIYIYGENELQKF
jgi:helix-turn-helix protein